MKTAAIDPRLGSGGSGDGLARRESGRAAEAGERAARSGERLDPATVALGEGEATVGALGVPQGQEMGAAVKA